MKLSKKTTILFSPSLHDRLSALAGRSGTSFGELVRTACESQYGIRTSDEKLAAIRKVSALKLPVSSVRRMKLESVPDPKDLI